MNTYLAWTKLTCLKMALFFVTCIVIAVAVGRSDVISSLLLGALGSYIYFLLLAYRVYRSAEMHPLVALRYMRAGTGLRMMFVCVMAVIGLKMPGVKVVPLFLGLFAYQIVVRIDNIYTGFTEHLKLNKGRKE